MCLSCHMIIQTLYVFESRVKWYGRTSKSASVSLLNSAKLSGL